MLFSKTAEVTPSETALPADVAISINSVSKRFKDFWALQNISFNVSKGECVGLVGFNGAGKSTLLQIIADTLQATEGEVATQGRVVAMLELGSGFNPEYTGIENLYMNAAILGIPNKLIDERLQEIIAFAEIGEHIDKPVKTYSSGMTVRLAFSLLTQIDPDIMIIDEALSVGDSYFAHKCTRLIKKYREQGKTFLFVSHNDSAVKSLCDRAILIDKGSLILDGKPSDVLDYYNAMVAHKERELEIRQIEKEEGRIVTRSGNGKACIDRFELMNLQNEPRRRFDIGTKARISCVIESQVDIPAPTVGFMIRDRFGNDIYGTNTYHLQTALKPLKAGEHVEVVFETSLNLGPGEYSLTLAVHEGSVHLENNYDWFDKLILFQVLNDPNQFFSGVAALPSSVQVSKEISPIHRFYNLGDTIDFTDTGNSHRYRVSGWHKSEHEHTWTNGNRSRIELGLPPSPSSLKVSLDLTPFICPTVSSQSLQIFANGVEIFKGALDKKQHLDLSIPKEAYEECTRIDFYLPNATSPSNEGVSNDTREIAFALHFAKVSRS